MIRTDVVFHVAPIPAAPRRDAVTVGAAVAAQILAVADSIMAVASDRGNRIKDASPPDGSR